MGKKGKKGEKWHVTCDNDRKIAQYHSVLQ